MQSSRRTGSPLTIALNETEVCPKGDFGVEPLRCRNSENVQEPK